MWKHNNKSMFFFLYYEALQIWENISNKEGNNKKAFVMMAKLLNGQWPWFWLSGQNMLAKMQQKNKYLLQDSRP